MSAHRILEEIRDDLRDFGETALRRLERIERRLGLIGDRRDITQLVEEDNDESLSRRERGQNYLARPSVRARRNAESG